MISIIIPSLPGFDKLNQDCVESFLSNRTTKEEVQTVLVVDNLPFAKNVNKGVSQAKGDLLLLSNNDILACRGWDEWLLRASKRRTIVGMTPSAGCGSCFGLKAELFKEIGELDENLINSYEDNDFFMRAALLGVSRTLPSSYFVIHEGGITINTVYGSLSSQSEKRLLVAHRNRDYMMKKWAGVNVDLVNTFYWLSHGVEIMKEWRSSSHGYFSS